MAIIVKSVFDLVVYGCYSVTLFEEFARKYYEEALKDLARARRALDYNDYPEVVFHAQQAVEKAVKALIESKHRYVYNHGPQLASIVIELFSREELEHLDEIVDTIEWFTEYYTRSRYPFVYRSRVYSPSEFIDEELAREALERAERVVRYIGEYLRGRGLL